MIIRAVTEEEFCLILRDMSARVESVDWHDNVKLVKLISEQLEVYVIIRAVHEPWAISGKCVTLQGSNQVHLLSLGATIHSVIYPGAEEDLPSRDVILGFDSPSGYDGTGNPFFWGTTGRFTNRWVDRGAGCGAMHCNVSEHENESSIIS